MLMPIHVLLFGLRSPGMAGRTCQEKLLGWSGIRFTRVYLLVLCSLQLFQWAHRFRFTLYDGLQIKHLNELITFLCMAERS